MATGFERRGEAQSPLPTGVDLAQKAGLQGNVAVPGVSRPAGINVQPVDTQVMNGLAEWGGKAIQDQAAKQMNKSLLDGQMAQAQGESFSTIETGGDKWKIEGFHQMEAQTLSAQLLEAQKAEISNSAYSLSPDEYRNQFNTRVDAMLDGKDPRVQEMVRKQITTQIPTLAGAQTGAYANYAAQRTYEAGVQAVHAISQDSSGNAALAAIADPGPNSPLAALGPNERRSAITDGVLFAFQNDNPGAYIKMKAAGTFNDFTPEQQARIEAGHKDWMARMSAQFDPVRMEAFTAFNTKLDNAEFATPMDAVNAAKGMYDKFGMDFDNQAAWQVQTAALTGIGTAQQTTANNIETAAVSGDIGAVADMIAPTLGMQNDANFRTEFGALVGINKGDWKAAVGDYLQAHPRNGVDASSVQWRKANLTTVRSSNGAEWQVNKAAQPAFEGFLKELEGMGYNLKSSGGYNYRTIKHSDGTKSTKLSEHATGNAIDINAAANAQGQTGTDLPPNVGAIAAKYGLEWGGNWKGKYADPMHFEYIAGKAGTQAAQGGMTADSVIASLTGTPTSQERLTASQNALALAQNNRQVADYAQMAPQRDDLDQKYIMGQMPKTDWQNQRGELYTKYHMQRTAGDVDTEIGITHAAEKQAREAGLAAAATTYGQQMAGAEAQMKSVVDSDTSTMAEKQAAIQTYSQQRTQLVTKLGLPRNPDQEFGFYRSMQKVWSDAVAAEEVNGPKRVAIARAAEVGTLGSDTSLDPKFRDKWYQGVLKDAQDTTARIVAKDPKLAPQANSMVQAAVMDKLAKAGYIPDGQAARYTASITGNLTDKNGVPTKEAISTVTDYMALRDKNPRVADMMFRGDAAIAKAVAIADWAGQNPANVETAIREYSSAPPMIKGTNTPADLEAHPEFQAPVLKAAKAAAFNTLSSWQQMDMFTSLPNHDAIQAAIADRASKLWATTGGIGDPQPFIDKAAMEIQSRTAMIGNAVVVAPAGINVQSEMFGNVDTSMEPDASDKAVRLYVAQHAGELGIDPSIAAAWSDRPTEGYELATPIVGGAKYIGQAYNAITHPFRSDAGQQGLFNFDATIWPNTFKMTNAGAQVSVTVIDSMGNPTLVSIPLNEAGRSYLQWRQSNTN